MGRPESHVGRPESQLDTASKRSITPPPGGTPSPPHTQLRLLAVVASVGSFSGLRHVDVPAKCLPRGALSAAFNVGDLGRMDLPTISRSVFLFVLAGLCEIGGGWLVWQWFRSGRSVALGVLGGLVLFLYGIVPTFQPAHFGRVYAAYGGVFVLLALLWGWRVDGTTPDRWDVIGASLCLSGVAVIMYAPRGI